MAGVLSQEERILRGLYIHLSLLSGHNVHDEAWIMLRFAVI